ncbi:Aspartate/glutamate/uridylate kinase [Pisolithus microcarpus]|nr:Aspartate/glutamate/uridylate kinase [Pisolithus microcarpus]
MDHRPAKTGIGHVRGTTDDLTRLSKRSPSSTIVIKLGTSSIVHEETHHPLLSILSSVVETVVNLRSHGHKVVLVSSGAIGVGLRTMNIPQRPKSCRRNRLSAVGQGRLIALWDNLFGQFCTRGDISDIFECRQHPQGTTLYGRRTIVNENDTISVSVRNQIRDNDTLSAITSCMIHRLSVLLTDVDGLYTANPRKDPAARKLDVVTSVADIRSQGAGVTTIITSSKIPSTIVDIIDYYTTLRLTSRPSSGTSSPVPKLQAIDLEHRPPHTVFKPSPVPVRDLKAWTSHTLYPAGGVIIDCGAHAVSRRESGGRLLRWGSRCSWIFASGQAVRILIRCLPEGTVAEERRSHSAGPDKAGHESSSSLVGDLESDTQTIVDDDVHVTHCSVEESDSWEVKEVGRGLANYNSVQISRVKGLNSSRIPQLLGYADTEYVVENITIRIPVN